MHSFSYQLSPTPSFTDQEVRLSNLLRDSQTPFSSLILRNETPNYFSVLSFLNKESESLYGPPPSNPVVHCKNIQMIGCNNFSFTSLGSTFRDEIIITRPLNEFISHIKNLQIPRVQLIVRVIKTLVLSIFRFHLSDNCLMFKDHLYIHSLDGKKVKTSFEQINKDYPYMLENAVTLVLKSKISPLTVEGLLGESVIPDSIREYYHTAYGVEITENKSGNSIRDLLNSEKLEVKENRFSTSFALCEK